MSNLFQTLALVLASATPRELARQIHYLKVENRILRGKLPKRIAVTPAERRRLVRFGAKLGRALVSIVYPETLRRWIREEKSGRPLREGGRKRKPFDVRKLVVKLARGNGWNYTPILGELKKLSVKAISRNTVKRILRIKVTMSMSGNEKTIC